MITDDTIETSSTPENDVEPTPEVITDTPQVPATPEDNAALLHQSFSYDSTKTIDENATELMELRASEMALDDTAFLNTVAGIKKDQLTASANASREIHVARREAEKVTALTKVDLAYYEQWKSIFNFGGIKEPTSKPFATFMLVVLIPFYFVITICISMPIAILKHLFSAINSLLEQIANFGKTGRSIAWTLLIFGAVALLGFLGYSLVMGIINGIPPAAGDIGSLPDIAESSSSIVESIASELPSEISSIVSTSSEVSSEILSITSISSEIIESLESLSSILPL